MVRKRFEKIVLLLLYDSLFFRVHSVNIPPSQVSHICKSKIELFSEVQNVIVFSEKHARGVSDL